MAVVEDMSAAAADAAEDMSVAAGGAAGDTSEPGWRSWWWRSRRRASFRYPLKQDLIPLVRLNNGLELYRFRYKGRDQTTYVGVMAQEVQKVEPSAVWRDRDGYLMVDYDRIGLKFMTWTEWFGTQRCEFFSLVSALNLMVLA